jgi:uncharacterized membrane protein YcfT
MFLIALLTGFSHHGEAADPHLLKWIKDTLDHLLGVGPWEAILSLGLLIVMIPVIVVAVYVLQQRRARKSTLGSTLD